jgi:hypothetical protein
LSIGGLAAGIGIAAIGLVLFGSGRRGRGEKDEDEKTVPIAVIRPDGTTGVVHGKLAKGKKVGSGPERAPLLVRA